MKNKLRFLLVALPLLSLTACGGTNMPGVIFLPGSVPYDHDATNFLGRAGINPRGAEAKAIGQLVYDLKQAHLWTNFYAIYPFLGGNSNSCAQNLVSTNYGVAWSGAVTFSRDGVMGDGLSASGDTHFVESSTGANTNNLHFYCYVVRHQSGSFGGFISAGQDGVWGGLSANIADFSSTAPNSDDEPSHMVTVGNGLVSRSATNLVYRMGLEAGAPLSSMFFDQINTLSTGVVTNSAKLLGQPDFVADDGGGYSKSTVATASVGRALTPTQGTNLFVIMNRFQSALFRNRQVGIVSPQ